MSLGEGRYRCVMCERGGHEIVELPWTQLQWAWVIDNVADGQASVPVSHPSHELAWAVNALEPWQHELAIWRGKFNVFAGPVMEPEWDDSGVVVPVRDLTQWNERRVLPSDRSFTDLDLALIYDQLQRDALAADTSPGLAVQPGPTGVKGSRTVVAATLPRAADTLRELAQNGVDYTTIGRTVLIGGEEVPAKVLPTLTNAMLTNRKVKKAGLYTATEVFLVGNSVTGTGTASAIVGHAGGKDSDLGLVQRVFNDSTVNDQHSADVGAQTRWDSLKRSPRFITADLVPARCPPLDRFVPGAVGQLEITAGAFSYVGPARLSKVSGSAQTGDSGVTETVSVELQPVGTIAATGGGGS